ncbi:MAG: ATP-binding protein [Lachnospiraceae bacterium]|nr:ATP-binding protein [Lachnospiraceae bacterium]
MSTDQKTSDKLLSRLFFSMLPVQILIFAMGSINSIVDGVMAGRFIGSTAVGVIGLYFPMVNIMTAVGSVLLGGTAVLCGRYMGRGELDKTEGVFSLNLTVTFIVSVLLTLCSVLLPQPVALMLGASRELEAGLAEYITGYAIGIIPMLFAQQLAAFLQMERQNRLGYVGVAGMILSNIGLDILLVGILKMDIFGLALATSLSNLIYFLILIPYYFTKKAQLHYGFQRILWKDLAALVKIGFPGALLVFCLAVRGMVINRILLRYEGNDGLSAMSSFSMVSGLFIAYCLGNGSVVRMLISVFVGEEDRSSMKKTLKIVFTKGLLLSMVLSGIIFAVSPLLTSVFFPDRTSDVYHLAYQLFAIYAFCIPLIMICQIFTNYLQATGHNLFVNVQSVFDGFFSMVIPSLLLAPIMGALGVWLSNPIGIFLTILTVPVYDLIYWKRIPKNMDEWMFLRDDFGVSSEDILDIPVRNMEEVVRASERIQIFCEEHDLSKNNSYYAALCLEEMAGNVVRHGFMADQKAHALNVLSIIKNGDITLRIKDDCIPFDPTEMAAIIDERNSFDNIGIRMVFSLADDVNYRNMLGLNVLTIKIREEDLKLKGEADYLLERTLKEMSTDLHARFKDTVFATQKLLTRYRMLFPEYTDHSELHSMTVIDSCNRLIGEEQITKLNADEIYCLLTACYLHDAGMGISEKDYEAWKEALGEAAFFAEHPDATKADFVRVYHNEFSGLFIDKYAELFEIPTKEHVFAIKQIVRGHRKTDLFDEEAYPSALQLDNGNTICLPYLAALIRISDEVDVVATRNPLILYDIDTLTDEVQIVENKKLNAVKSMKMTKDAFILSYETDEEAIFESMERMVEKMQKTLEYCAEVVEKRTRFHVTQKKVVLRNGPAGRG